MAAADTTPQHTTIADNLSEKQEQILRVFHNEDGTVNTHDITAATGYDNRIVAYHINEKLIANDLVERDGVDNAVTRVPHPPNQYILTEEGEEVLRVLRQWDAETEAEISRVDELEEQVAQLQKENDRLWEELESVEERFDGRFDQLKEWVGRRVGDSR